MASEYLKQKYKDVKPDTPRELTKAEKRENWWHYHKWHVVIGVIAALVAVYMILDIFFRKDPVPDYQIAYVGAGQMPEETAAAIEAAAAAMGEDLNGDGQVLVRLRQYVSDKDGDPNTLVAASVQLMVDVAEQESFLFLLENPAEFQQGYHTLCRLDGSLPEEADNSAEDCVLAWSQCPVLAGMDLGEYAYDLLGGTISGDSQEFMSRLFIGRRGFWADDTPEFQAGYTALWEKLTAGAVS